MDTSETYIKMCDTLEIQNKVKEIEYPNNQFLVWWNKGIYIKCPKCNWYGYEDSEYCTVCGTKMKHIEEPYPSHHKELQNAIWLPRQDQIQEMIDDSWVITFECFDTWYFNTSYPGERYPNDVFKSMEQMWLAFYMWEKHRKVWDGDKWAKTQ